MIFLMHGQQFVKYANAPFGDPNSSNPGNDRFKIANGKNNEKLHTIWRQSRQKCSWLHRSNAPFLQARCRGP